MRKGLDCAPTNRLYHRLTVEDLRLFAAEAMEEESDFFRRNPHLEGPYRQRLLAIALCQGAALHYLDGANGVKDIDIHLFYLQDPEHPRLSRTVVHRPVDIPGFGPRRMDFIRTVIPIREPLKEGLDGIVRTLHWFLKERPTSNAVHLARKAVVLLHPEMMLGSVVWPSS